MALILPRSYHKIEAIERNRISWIEPELAERQDIRPLRIGILNIMPLGKQYEFNLLHPLVNIAFLPTAHFKDNTKHTVWILDDFGHFRLSMFQCNSMCSQSTNV